MIKQMTVQELQAELLRYFKKQQEKKPAFSIRSLALQLGVNSSTLQKIFRGDRQLGARLAKEVALRLDVEIIRSPKAGPAKRTRRFWNLPLDAQSSTQMSWLNLAVLETLKLQNFKPNAAWIARRLGVPTEVVASAIANMVEAKMLLCPANSPWIDLLDDAASDVVKPSFTAEFRETQRALMKLSSQSFEQDLYDEREHGFAIMPVNSKHLPRLKKFVQKFRWELAELAQNSQGPKDSIYSVEVGFFPITKKELSRA